MVIYAVLIGINEYPVKPLSGCINDVTAMQQFLEAFASNSKAELQLKVLTDHQIEKPTKENFINSFKHFEPAAAGDFCLFYYSGHGSYSLAPKEFWTETDGSNESFVCIDSRIPGGKDLMDKEFGFLTWKTFKNKPDVNFIVITDCCHSGTITRAMIDDSEITDRMTSPNATPLTVNDYYGYGEAIDGEQGYVVSEDGKRVTPRQVNHIHLAASRDNQTAKELIIEGNKRGAFTFSLLKTLHICNGLISYKELVEKTSAQVKNIVTQQEPDVHFYGGDNKIFLTNNDQATNPLYFVYHDPKYGWCIKAGQLQGIAKDDVVIIDGVAQSKVTGNIQPDLSTILEKIEFGPSENNYRASVLRKSIPSLSMAFAPDVQETIKELLNTATFSSPSPFVQISDAAAQFYIHTDKTGTFISFPGSTTPIFKPVMISNQSNADYFLDQCELVSKWNNLKVLDNPASKITSQHYTVKLYRAKIAGNYDASDFEQVPVDSENDFYYKKIGEKWAQPAMRLSITNNSPADLWMCCAYMAFDFGIAGNYFSPVRIAPQQEVWLSFQSGTLASDIIKLQVDKKYQNLGYNEIVDYLKLFISTEKIDPSSLTQSGVELPVVRTRNIDSKGIGEEEDLELLGSDWKTETIGLKIIKPNPDVSILPGKETTLNEVKILQHASLDAKINLTSSAHTSRAADSVSPPHLANKNSNLEPFDLLSSTRSDKVMDVLELLDVKDASVVTADSPLIITSDSTRSGSIDNILPIGYDAETRLYYPLGYTNDEGQIVIESLPAETPSDSAITQRSFFGSIKIYFQKVIGQKLGIKYSYPRLAIPTINEKLEVTYDSDETNIKNAVQNAKKVFVFIHGIIGDTEGMVACTKQITKDAFDLVLTFDYENLNTPIEENAQLFKERLLAAGFGENDDKQLTIIAHSMGGLISRWFIEKLGGNKIADRLIMLGTPNNGSPWADVRDLADTLLTYAINGAMFLKPFSFILSGIGKLVGGLQVTLKQMDAKTGIYSKLNDGTDPGIPYLIIAGNTKSIIPNYDKTATLINRLFTRLKKRGMYDALDLVLFKKPNDIAATGESVTQYDPFTNYQIKPLTYEVACDHLNYFVTADAVNKID